MLTTCPYLNNIEFHDFDVSGLQSHFITSVTIAVRILTLSVRRLELNLVCWDQNKSFSVRPSGVNMSSNVRPWLR